MAKSVEKKKKIVPLAVLILSSSCKIVLVLGMIKICRPCTNFAQAHAKKFQEELLPIT